MTTSVSRSIQEAVSKKVRHYEGLLKEVALALKLGRERAQEALEREKSRTYWEVGRLIDSHVLQSGERGDYGKKVIKRLAADLKTNQTLLYYALQFARSYPALPESGAMTWSHYRALLPVKDEDSRRTLEEQTEELGWSSRRLESEVTKLQRRGRASAAERRRKPGRFDVRRVAGCANGRVSLDLGFSILTEVPSGGKSFSPGMLVTAAGTPGAVKLIRGAGLDESDLYAYKAVAEEILPEKIRLLVEIAPGLRHRRFFSLRHPEEINGRKAPAWLQEAVLRRLPLAVRTCKEGEDRYSVEIFEAL